MAGVTVPPSASVARLRRAVSPFGIRARGDDLKRFGSREAVCKSRIRVAVIRKTTGERNLRDRCPAMIPRVYETADDAVLDLTKRRVEAVVHDAPVLAYLMSQQAAPLELVPTDIADEPLAWMVRRDDTRIPNTLLFEASQPCAGTAPSIVLGGGYRESSGCGRATRGNS
jgi:ABC-type amino acid transport substrate-binding protein